MQLSLLYLIVIHIWYIFDYYVYFVAFVYQLFNVTAIVQTVKWTSQKSVWMMTCQYKYTFCTLFALSEENTSSREKRRVNRSIKGYSEFSRQISWWNHCNWLYCECKHYWNTACCRFWCKNLQQMLQFNGFSWCTCCLMHVCEKKNASNNFTFKINV